MIKASGIALFPLLFWSCSSVTIKKNEKGLHTAIIVVETVPRVLYLLSNSLYGNHELCWMVHIQQWPVHLHPPCTFQRSFDGYDMEESKGWSWSPLAFFKTERSLIAGSCLHSHRSVFECTHVPNLLEGVITCSRHPAKSWITKAWV